MEASVGIWFSACITALLCFFCSPFSHLGFLFLSQTRAKVANGSDLVLGLIVADHLDVVFVVLDQRQDFAWFLQERLTVAYECELKVWVNLAHRACLVVQNHPAFDKSA